VGKGSNLTIFAINDQLNRYFRKHGKFPRVLYLQIDGGAENANEVSKSYTDYGFFDFNHNSNFDCVDLDWNIVIYYLLFIIYDFI
jgi:hypothetical protein